MYDITKLNTNFAFSKKKFYNFFKTLILIGFWS
jgi:hypothetical protein